MNSRKASAAADRELTPPYARYLVPLIRPFPNFDLFFVKSLRQRAVRRLQLHPGDRVIDAGCGPGGSFPLLVDAVTQSGVVVGVEISPDMALTAKKRVEKNGWTNVEVIVGDAKKVELQGTFDALLLLGAPDVYASPAALANLAPYLKRDARIVAFGAKLPIAAWERRSTQSFVCCFRKPPSPRLPNWTMSRGKRLRAALVRLRSKNSSLAGCSWPGA